MSLFCRMIRNYWTSQTPSRSQSQGNLSNTIPSSSPSCITRMRYLISAHNQYSNDHVLPLYVKSSFEMETLRFHPKNSSSLSKICVGLAFQAVLAKLFQTSPSGPSQDQPPFLGVIMVIAFAASFSGNFLSHSKPRLAAIVEKTGCLSTAMGFFVMITRAFLSGSLATWVIGCLAGVFTLLAFLVSCLT